jgi:purine-nucleoside phosphorylase
MLQNLEEAAAFVRAQCQIEPRIGLILGSGLGGFVDAIEPHAVIPYQEIPHAPSSSVVGHQGRLVLGFTGSVPVIVMQGRVHYYEGYSMEEVLFLPRLLARLGARRVVVTNAAGGVTPDLAAGDLMLISDHVNFFGVNPLRGRNFDDIGVRFPDLTEAYPLRLREIARRVAGEIGLTLKEGVYFGLSGPTYETPAEVRMFRLLGADALGMSTVPEVVSLNHMGLEVLGISCITNMAAGILPQKLDHAEVLETTRRIQKEFVQLIVGLVPELDQL